MPKESTKATITSFAGTPLVRVVDGSNSRNISPANLVAESGAQAALDSRYAPLNRRYVYLPGTDEFIHTAHKSSYNLNGDAEWVWRMRLSDYTPASGMTIVAKRSTGEGLAWQITFGGTTGNIQLGFRTGGVDYFSNAEATNPGWVDGVWYWFRLRRVASTGTVTAHYAADSPTEPTTWTSLTVTGTQTAGGFNGQENRVEIGTNRAGSNLLTGMVQRVIVRDGIAGTDVMDFNADAAALAGVVGGVGETWTITGTAPAVGLIP